MGRSGAGLREARRPASQPDGLPPMTRTVVIGVTAALVAALAVPTARASTQSAWSPPSAPTTAGRIAADPIAHDPTIIKQGRYYYSIITGDAQTRTYLPIRRSTDLLHWTTLGTVFTTAPAWLTQELGVTPGDFWAPEVAYFDGAYHLYYAASSFGTNNSVIGLATAKTLDPGSAEYGWVDHGMVMRSYAGDPFNAIDPDLVFDAEGQPWLSFGSFWDGIRMRRIDRNTGLPADDTLHPVASRGGASIEAPSIVHHDGFYYLFASLDFCCRGVNSDYRVVVGRATTITGPYLDRAGVPMLSGGGTDVLRGYNEFRGTGGGDVFTDRGGDWFAHHYYDVHDAGLPKLSVRRISWAGGWPTLGDPLSGSTRVGHGSAWFTVLNRATGTVIGNPSCGYEGADLLLAGSSDSTCQQWRPEDRGDGYASLLNRSSNKVAEIAACVNTDGARVALWGWLDNDCQKFRLAATEAGWSRIENRLAGRVLTPAGCGGAGTPVRADTWVNNACQQFRLDPVGEVLIADSAGQLVLGVDHCARLDGPAISADIRSIAGGASQANPAAVARTRIGASQRHNNACQLWRFAPTREGYFRIINRGVNRPMTAVTGRHGEVRLVLGPPDDLAPAAQWRVEALDGEGYRLVNLDGRVAQLPGLAARFLLLSP
jgi:arabinan endo-1,5-alpha-L-arabinosidase